MIQPATFVYQGWVEATAGKTARKGKGHKHHRRLCLWRAWVRQKAHTTQQGLCAAKEVKMQASPALAAGQKENPDQEMRRSVYLTDFRGRSARHQHAAAEAFAATRDQADIHTPPHTQ
mmetsp:Transcript_29461/g.57717  ORF Transcript_29461/g.57717 Transcript_29461/m.57717 type:complete len:118 (-) Transcript_29461:1264-1617(-)